MVCYHYCSIIANLNIDILKVTATENLWDTKCVLSYIVSSAYYSVMLWSRSSHNVLVMWLEGTKRDL